MDGTTGGVELETERLLLRPFERDDLEPLAALHREESFWWYPFQRAWSDDETEAWLDRTIERGAAGEAVVGAVVVRVDGRLAGWSGLASPWFLPEVLPALEVGWRLGEAFRGKGYATEAGRAWVHHGFATLGLDEILSIYEPANVASGAVMARLGFHLERETVHPTLGVPLHVLVRRRDDPPT